MDNQKQIEELINLIFGINCLLREEFRYQNLPNQLSWVNIHTLLFVKKNNRPTMKEVAEYLNVARPSATIIVDNYVKNEQLKRVFDKNDRRMVRLMITPKGEQVLKNSLESMKKVIKKILLNLDDQQIKSFTDILKAISEKCKR